MALSNSIQSSGVQQPVGAPSASSEALISIRYFTGILLWLGCRTGELRTADRPLDTLAEDFLTLPEPLREPGRPHPRNPRSVSRLMRSMCAGCPASSRAHSRRSSPRPSRIHSSEQPDQLRAVAQPRRHQVGPVLAEPLRPGEHRAEQRRQQQPRVEERERGEDAQAEQHGDQHLGRPAEGADRAPDVRHDPGDQPDQAGSAPGPAARASGPAGSPACARPGGGPARGRGSLPGPGAAGRGRSASPRRSGRRRRRRSARATARPTAGTGRRRRRPRRRPPPSTASAGSARAWLGARILSSTDSTRCS